MPIVDGKPDAAALAAVENDPNCFTLYSRFPGGFTPQFGGLLTGPPSRFRTAPVIRGRGNLSVPGYPSYYPPSVVRSRRAEKSDTSLASPVRVLSSAVLVAQSAAGSWPSSRESEQGSLAKSRLSAYWDGPGWR